ncbi:MAG: class I SAM-dependent RNA methyltransferase, partial [Polaromonas sp.]
HVWAAIRDALPQPSTGGAVTVFGSDVSHRMVDFAERNAERAGVAGISGVQSRDQRDQRRQQVDDFGQPIQRDERDEPAFDTPRDRSANPGREQAQNAWGEEASDFFPQLAAHWKKHYAGWTAHVLTPDLKLPSKMRLKESRRVPMWNGPIECRLFRFDMVAGSARGKPVDQAAQQPKP